MKAIIGYAINDACNWHEGQYDRGNNAYIGHVIRVAWRLQGMGTDVIIAALLHDVVEDTDCTLEWVREHYGDEIATAVNHLTHRAGEDYWDYINRVSGNEIARVVKLADLADNMSGWRKLPDAAWQERAVARYQRAVDLLS